MKSGKSRQSHSSIPSSDQLLTFGKVPPQATEIETIILGAILLEKEAIERAMDIIQPRSFYNENHQLIYSAALLLHKKQQPVDLATVANELNSAGNLERIGGAFALTKLTNAVVSSANLEAHCAIVQQKFIRRELIRVGGEMITDAYDEQNDEFALLEDSEKKVLEIGTSNLSTSVISMDDALLLAMQKISEFRKMDSTLTGVPSGFPALDKATRGWQPENLIILAARPSVGKTAFALNLVRNAALHPEKPTPVAVWSLEMGVVELVLRMLAAESSTWLYKIQTGRLEEYEMKQIYEKGVQKLSQAKIFFDDSSHVTISSFRSKARRLKKKHNIGLIMVDYLQLMSGDSDKGNREQEISKISRAMKQLAKELQIPIIALSQLSRDVEKRTGSSRRPQLSDLRESGAIEQDSDVVMFLWGPTDEEVAQDASLIGRRYVRIAKQRNGQLMKEEFDFKNEIQLFESIDSVTNPTGSWKPVKLDLPEAPASHYEVNKNDDLPF